MIMDSNNLYAIYYNRPFVPILDTLFWNSMNKVQQEGVNVKLDGMEQGDTLLWAKIGGWNMISYFPKSCENLYYDIENGKLYRKEK